MQEAQIDTRELERLIEKLEQSPKVLSEAKRRAFEAAAPKLKALLDQEIGGTGRVRGWQESIVGSKGGFAKVRPKAKTWAESRGSKTYAENGPKRYAVGYITNAINSGRQVRTRKTFAQERGYSIGSVPGKHFYAHVQDQADTVAQETAEEIVAALLEHLEG